MYVCICNGLTDRDVKRAARDGASTAKQCFQALDASPQCCRCLPMMREIIDETRAEAEAEVAGYGIAAE